MKNDAVVNAPAFSVVSELDPCGNDIIYCVSGSANGILNSTFTISGTESAFIAGYGDLTWSDFKSGYHGYYYQDSSVIDAEKCSTITQDNMMCWAGTAANMLYYTGWGLVGADTEDKVFSVFINNFTLGATYGGNAYYAIDWYFTGNYSPKTWSEWDIPLENSGGFYSETFKTEKLSSYLSSTTFTVSGLTTAKQKLEAGYGVGVTFGYYNSSGTRTGGHLITLWGVTCDSSYSVTDPRYYTGIIVTDSDDNKSVSDPLSAPDTLKIISITYDSSLGAYLIDPDYAGANSRLEHLTFLAPNTGHTPDEAGPVRIYSDGALVKAGESFSRVEIKGTENDTMHISSGGWVSGTFISSGGAVYVSGGGLTEDTEVYRGGKVTILGEEIPEEYRALHGSAKKLTVYTGGTAVVSGGEVSSFLVSSGGTASVMGVQDVAAVDVYGSIHGTEIKSGGSLTIGNGTEFWGSTVWGGSVTVNGWANVYGELNFDLSERTADDIYIVDDITNLYLDDVSFYSISVSENQANGTYKLAGNASSFNETVFIDGEDLTVNGTGVTISGKQYTLAVTDSILTLTIGAAVPPVPVGDQVKVYSSGTLVKQGTVLTGETIIAGLNDSMFVYAGGTASNTQVSSGAFIYVSSGGVADSTCVDSVGRIRVYNGGVASNTLLSGGKMYGSYGGMDVYNGAVANNTTVSSGGFFNVSLGGMASGVTVNSAGNAAIFGRASGISVFRGGEFRTYSQAVVSGLTACEGAFVGLEIGPDSYVQGSYAGSAFEIKNGLVADYAINTGYVHLRKGAAANDVTVKNVAWFRVYADCSASGTTVSGGSMFVCADGSARDTTVSRGGSMLIEGGKHTHTLTVADGAVVSAYDGGIIDFTVSARSVSDGYLINDLSLIQGTPVYTITVSADQAQGVYKLAQGADGFKGTLTIGNGTIDYGKITVNGADLVYGNVAYSLDLYKGDLTLNIGNVAPAGDQVKVFSSGTLVKQGTVLTGETIVGGANNSMFVYDGGTASNTQVSSGANMYVSSGGTAKDTLVEGGRMTVYSGGVANEADFNSGDLIVRGGKVSQVTLKNGAQVSLYSSAELIDATHNGGLIKVYSGAAASNLSAELELTSRSGYALTHVSSGGVANTVDLGHRGYLFVYGGGFVSGVSIRNSGTMSVRGEEYTSEGGEMAEALYGSAKEVTVSSGGYAYITGGEVSGLLVSSGGIASVAGVVDVSAVDVYGKLYSAEVKYGGTLTIGSGGVELWEDTVLGGTVTVNSWANIYGELIFDLSERSAGDTYIVDNIANLNLTEVGCYSVTVSDNQANGTYKLAGNAASFSDTVTVKGTALSVNGAGVAIGDKHYTIAVTDSILTLTIGAADQVPPVLTVSGNAVEWTNKDVVLQVVCDDPEAVVSCRIDNGDWTVCTGTLTVESNCSIEFRAVDRAGNTATEKVIVDKIDKVAPEAPKVTADITEFTNQAVTLTADYGDAVKKEFSYNNHAWYTYNGGVVLNSNTTVYFRGSDALGNVSDISSYNVSNIDNAAPEVPDNVTVFVDGNNAVADWSDVGDSGVSGIKGYFVRTGNSENMTGNGTFVEASLISLENLAEGTWYCQIASVDKAGNMSEWSTVKSFVIGVAGPENLVSTPQGLRWNAVGGASGYVVEYSYDDFESAVAVETVTNALDTSALPGTTFKWRVRALESSVWSFGSEVTGNGSVDAEEIVSDNDGDTDLFFANANDLWSKGYAAENKFTGERIMLAGKNRLDEIFEGSSDANVLVLTDDLNGDALFVDDIYTALGDRARMEQIDEIRAGAGADVIDMTSLRYVYDGKEITIHGGDGDDVIWAGGTDSVLFGDAGDDRLAGSTCFDVFAGGSGNDTMCSGGGNDIFVFSGEFGNDTVEITDYSEVTLWFDAGSSENWDPVSRIYRSGGNSVTVTGSGTVDLKFGDEDSRYAELAEAGLFDDVSSRKIFEEKDKGMLA